MLVGQLPRTYRSLPRPNLMTPRHPPRALRSLTTPIGPPRRMLLPKHKHHATAILTTGSSFEIEDFPSPASHDAKLDPDLINQIRKGSQELDLLVASS
jgi:hypothetical protein